jgi:hypothetical protein
MVDTTDLIALNQNPEEKGLKLAKVTELFETGTVKIQFYGEDTPSEKEYSYLASYTPATGDTVLMIPMAETYIVLGKILYSVVIPEIGYVTTEQLNSALSAYAKSSELTIYVKSADLSTTLNSYAKTSDLNNYATKTYVSNSLSGYAPTSHYHTEIHNSNYTQYAVDVAKSLNGLPYFSPSNNGVMACGGPNYKWDVVYALSGTINTSDESQKEQIRDISESERNVALKIKKLFRLFKFKDAVLKKGDNARIHTGVIAQDVKAAFESEGLNPYEYAMFCSDTWEEDGTEVTQLGLRYEELLCFVISAI